MSTDRLPFRLTIAATIALGLACQSPGKFEPIGSRADAEMLIVFKGGFDAVAVDAFQKRVFAIDPDSGLPFRLRSIASGRHQGRYAFFVRFWPDASQQHREGLKRVAEASPEISEVILQEPTRQPSDRPKVPLTDCSPFESLDLGEIEAAALRGRTLAGTDDGAEPLPAVQVAARAEGSGEIEFVITGGDGSFAIQSLRPGAYDVWTCLEGFDELRFRLTIAPGSTGESLDLYVGPSEAPGRREVVVVRSTSPD